MKVWIVHSGCRHEGGSARGVYSTKDKAIAAAKDFIEKDAVRDRELHEEFGEPGELPPTEWSEEPTGHREFMRWAKDHQIVDVYSVELDQESQ